ncbi:hypothetical protein HKBW3S43_00579 [Candidatus Hakubella thermalkaliphila]|uniref:Uncharacterized protein n=1 Tax=Candidatus Hakubella thermalkaliphila TaxID=2754717 RepID=A0A6V8PRA9_9ACTN|nr:hypothetical protein [Candidatus Hakubella thermalkaliphila]GFP34787.1 hypothetical protein HKBW3S43_00579 [Candidatus Hakubella thermalkaliphila]
MDLIISNYGTFIQLILALSTAMDLDEKVKLYHGWQVAVWASKMAEEAFPQQLTPVFLCSTGESLVR